MYVNCKKAWTSVLEANYILFRLRPHHANFNKRLVKAPKLYFHDPGLACWFLGIQTPQHLESHPLRGAVFETLIVAELLKSSLNRGGRPDMYFWRDSNGNEVDVIIEAGDQLIPLEIKSGKTVARDFFAGLEKWKNMAGTRALNPILIYGGDDKYRHVGTDVIGWRNAGQAALDVRGAI